MIGPFDRSGPSACWSGVGRSNDPADRASVHAGVPPAVQPPGEAARVGDCARRAAVRVAPAAGAPAPPTGEPAIACLPTAAFQQAIDYVLRNDAQSAWRHGPTEGQPALREAIAD